MRAFTAANSIPLIWALLALVAGPDLSAQAKPQPKKAPGARSGRLRDGTNPTSPYAVSDAVEFSAAIGEEVVACELTMTKPLPEGLFTTCHVRIDTDDNDKTGVGGYDLWVRGTIGSRFRGNGQVVGADGETPAKEIRTTYSQPIRSEDRSLSWLHQHDQLSPPTIDGNKMSFTIPLRFMTEKNNNYTSIFNMTVTVETSCSDQALDLPHLCNDDGLSIEIDGTEKPNEWSGDIRNDPKDELHPAVRRLDIEAFRVDHGVNGLYALVRFAEPGFAQVASPGDVRDESQLVFYIDPMFPRYQEAALLAVRAGKPSREGRTRDGIKWKTLATDRTVELQVERRQGQTRFKVFAWSDYRCYDDFADRLRLDWTAK